MTKKKKKKQSLVNWITNFLFDKVNHCGRLCELISIAYLIKALVGVYMCHLSGAQQDD